MSKARELIERFQGMQEYTSSKPNKPQRVAADHGPAAKKEPNDPRTLPDDHHEITKAGFRHIGVTEHEDGSESHHYQHEVNTSHSINARSTNGLVHNVQHKQNNVVKFSGKSVHRAVQSYKNNH